MTRLLWIALVILATSTASADPTKIALTIKGDSAKIGLRKAVIDAFAPEDDLKFVSAKKKARIVVQGTFNKSAHKLKLTVFKNGKKGATFSITVADSSSEKFRKAVRKKMLAKLGVDTESTEVAAAESSAEEPKTDEAKAEDSPKAEVADAEAPAKAVAAPASEPKHHKTQRDRHGAGSDDEDPIAGDREESSASAHAAIEVTGAQANDRQHPAISVDVGATMIGRSITFKTNGAEGTPSSYRARTAAGGTVAAEAYPLAFGDRSRVIAGLGIGGELDQAIGFKVQTSDGTMLPVTERHYAVGARFRVSFGHRATSPTVTLGAGYAARSFAIRSTMPTGLPDVDYRAFEPSLVARVPITRRVTAFAGGSGMLAQSAGDIASAAQYGRAHITGGTASVGVDVGLASHVALRVSGEGTQVKLKFFGDGTMTGVYSALDRYYGGSATLALTY